MYTFLLKYDYCHSHVSVFTCHYERFFFCTGHCAKLWAIMKNSKVNKKASGKKWLIVVDDDTILRLVSLQGVNNLLVCRPVIFPSICLSVHQLSRPSIVNPIFNPFVCPCFCRFVFPYIPLFVRLPFFPFFFPSIYLRNYLLLFSTLVTFFFNFLF